MVNTQDLLCLLSSVTQGAINKKVPQLESLCGVIMPLFARFSSGCSKDIRVRLITDSKLVMNVR